MNSFLVKKNHIADILYKTVDLLLSTLKLLYICELLKKSLHLHTKFSIDIDLFTYEISFKVAIIHTYKSNRFLSKCNLIIAELFDKIMI